MAFENPAGASVTQSLTHYGPRTTNQSYGGTPTTKGTTKEIVWVFSYDDLPAYSTSSLEQIIPAYATIIEARVEILTAFAGGTTYNFGLYQATGATSVGTVIDADGIDAAVALAVMDARGDVVHCDGALVSSTATGNVVSIGAEPAELTVAATGTYTAGKAKLVITYVPEGPGGA